MLWFLLLACAPRAVVADGPMTTPPRTDATVDEPLTSTSALVRFSWVEPEVLAAMGYPRDLDAVAATGVVTLVSLTEVPPDPDAVATAGMAHVHIPIQDYTAPTLQQMLVFVETVEDGIDAGEPVGVHCAAGLGRSGTMAAAWFISQGMSADEALATIRELRPGSVETLAQEQVLEEFAALYQRD